MDAHRLAKQIQNAVTQYNIDITDQETFIALMLSRAIAFNLNLPTSAVESPDRHFAEIHLVLVDELLSAFNERQVIPYDETRDLIRKLWLYRYKMVYSPTVVQAFNLVNAVSAADSSFNSAKVEEFFSTYNELKYTVSDIWHYVATQVEVALNGDGNV